MASTHITQAKRWIVVDSPLGEDTLIPTFFEGDETISRLFTYRLELISNMTSIAPESILGKEITIHLRRPDGKTRIFHGRINRFGAGPMWSHGYRHYQAEVVPWTWFLTRTTDCRIFEDEKVPDIIEKIFKDLGFSDFDLSGVDKGKHPKREYCVQYRETDFNFVSRLMEEEGMYYFFKHEQGKHTMMIADKTSALPRLRRQGSKVLGPPGRIERHHALAPQAELQARQVGAARLQFRDPERQAQHQQEHAAQRSAGPEIREV